MPGNPLEHHPTWKHTTCPTCKGKAVRETDTLDTFVDSSWYFARFTDSHAEEPVNRDGGRLLDAGRSVYRRRRARDPASALCALLHPRDARSGHVQVDEPFAGLFTQGMVCHETYQDTDGALAGAGRDREARRQVRSKRGTNQPVTVGASEKMSKSKKNVVAPEAIIDAYGADTIRWFMLSDTPPERDIEWTAGRRGRLLAFRPAHLSPGDRGRRPAAGRHERWRRRRRGIWNCAAPRIAPSQR